MRGENEEGATRPRSKATAWPPRFSAGDTLKTDGTADAELLARFWARDASCEAEVAKALGRALWGWSQRHGLEVQDAFEELRGEAFALLWRWRREGRRTDETLSELAHRLLRQVAKQFLRDEQSARLLAGALEREAPPEIRSEEAAVDRRRLGRNVKQWLSLIPLAHAETLRALLAEVAGAGPPVAEALGCEVGAARMRVLRARAALLEVAAERGMLENLDEVLDRTERADG